MLGQAKAWIFVGLVISKEASIFLKSDFDWGFKKKWVGSVIDFEEKKWGLG